jgi:hypothetical protein
MRILSGEAGVVAGWEGPVCFLGMPLPLRLGPRVVVGGRLLRLFFREVAGGGPWKGRLCRGAMALAQPAVRLALGLPLGVGAWLGRFERLGMTRLLGWLSLTRRWDPAWVVVRSWLGHAARKEEGRRGFCCAGSAVVPWSIADCVGFSLSRVAYFLTTAD